MRYHWCPRMFPWRHWESLWRNNLPDLECVKGVATKTIFVAIDTEPWLDHKGHNLDDKEAREIGIAFLSPSADQGGQACEPPRTLAETYQRFDISSHCIRIRGRQRLSGEHFWNGSTEAIIYVKPDEVEETILNLLQSTQKLSTAPGGPLLPLTLVGFDLHAEFRILANQYPRLLGSFTSWVDVRSSAKKPQHVPRPRAYEIVWPPLGNDAMRTISVLVHLLHYPPRGHELAQTCSTNNSGRAKQREHRQWEKINMKKTGLFAKRYPHPREKYPFRAKVDLPGASFTGHPDAGILCEYFLRFQPVAAGSNKSGEFGGWICLASLEELRIFVEEVHGLEDAEKRGTWVAVSQYDPTVVPATTAAELDEYLTRRSASEAAEKKQARLEKKCSDRLHVAW